MKLKLQLAKVFFADKISLSKWKKEQLKRRCLKDLYVISGIANNLERYCFLLTERGTFDGNIIFFYEKLRRLFLYKKYWDILIVSKL